MIRRRSPPSRSALIALAATLVSLAACHKDEAAPLRVAVIGDGAMALGDALAPPNGEAQADLRLNLAQGLVRFDSSGQVEPGLAERWNVSDDGLSYIFRLAAGEWPDGRKIMARDVARILKRQIKAAPDNATRDALGAVTDVVAMTDRVIEIQLAAPRPNLLELLAQPEFALIREGVGSGPFALREAAKRKPGSDPDVLQLTRTLPGVDGEASVRDDVWLRTLPVVRAIPAFRAGQLDLVLGGTLADLPLATRAKLDRDALHFDPASGLFGLVPGRADGPLAKPEIRRLLSAAIDRAALIAALGVPGLVPRATTLEAGLEGLPDPVQPAWLAQPPAARHTVLAQEAQRLFGNAPRPRLSLALPDGPGGDLVYRQLFADWGALGIGVERAPRGVRADLRFVDLVAPSSSPAWFLRQFRCTQTPICVAAADPLLDAARNAPDAAQRGALLGQAASLIDGATLFIPLAAPIRWSLVGDRALGYQDNRFARHSLADVIRRDSRGF